MAYAFYVTIKGAKQGDFKGEVSRPATPGPPDAILGLAFHYEVSSPRDPATGLVTGKRQHSPIAFVKEWGASSPQLFQAAVTNEALISVAFEFFAAQPAGQGTAPFYKIALTNASVVSIKQDVQGPPPGVAGETRDLEEVSLVFQKIEVESYAGKTVAADDWMTASRAPGTAPLASGAPVNIAGNVVGSAVIAGVRRVNA